MGGGRKGDRRQKGKEEVEREEGERMGGAASLAV